MKEYFQRGPHFQRLTRVVITMFCALTPGLATSLWKITMFIVVVKRGGSWNERRFHGWRRNDVTNVLEICSFSFQIDLVLLYMYRNLHMNTKRRIHKTYNLVSYTISVMNGICTKLAMGFFRTASQIIMITCSSLMNFLREELNSSPCRKLMNFLRQNFEKYMYSCIFATWSCLFQKWK